MNLPNPQDMRTKLEETLDTLFGVAMIVTVFGFIGFMYWIEH